LAYRIEVYLQTRDRSMQRIAVHAEFIGSLALISSFLPKNNQHEGLLEFSHRLIETHTGVVHLLHDRIELCLHNQLLGSSSAIRKDIKEEKAVILVML
jgi:hypothetical protein